MQEKELQDYIAAFKRKKKPAFAIFGGILFLSLLIAFLLPPAYRSTATILIEEQEIPTELVRSTITTYATQRLQMINQRVMSRANLEQIIKKFDLYSKERQKLAAEEVIEKMRKDISLDTISADVIDPRTGHPSTATIAFTLSYEGRNPEVVQRVANEITSLYLEENLKVRTQKTAETSDFLREEAKQMGEYVSRVEQKLADFKETHLNRLPEQKQLTIQLLDRTERDLMDVDIQIRSMEERRFYLDGQLAQIKPDSPIVSSSGERIFGPEDRLKTLRTQYLSLSSAYSDKHPDVVKMRTEIQSLERETGAVDNALEQTKELEQLRGQLASLRDRYSENHPEVIELTKRIAVLEASIHKAGTASAVKRIAQSQPENPAYITLQAQRDSAVQDMASLAQKRTELKAKLAEYEKWLVQSPDVERQYMGLVRDYDNATLRYRELKAKEMEADVAEQLEKKSKGERFSIIEPPLLPEKPVKPNRPALAFLGLVLSITCAGGYVTLTETLDRSIRGSKTVAALTGSLPLAVIPFIATDEAVAEQKRTLIVAAAVAMGAVILALILVHLLWTPLDVLWFRGIRKIDKVLI
ncbi:MAG TPA: lipopolysaccharide biosynthesis protein [Methylococcaceae bacterium]|nr:lipopolysaccharide biosynthesis protein [Methylococcaceae bacterium]